MVLLPVHSLANQRNRLDKVCGTPHSSRVLGICLIYGLVSDCSRSHPSTLDSLLHSRSRRQLLHVDPLFSTHLGIHARRSHGYDHHLSVCSKFGKSGFEVSISKQAIGIAAIIIFEFLNTRRILSQNGFIIRICQKLHPLRRRVFSQICSFQS